MTSLAGLPLTRIINAALVIVVVVVSASLHEFGHAYAAWRCGDPTAAEQGRLTINPAAHVDPFGSVLLPLILSLAGGVTLAYAKPVPYDPRRLRDRRRDEVIVAVAGPAMNLIQAIVGAVAFRIAAPHLVPLGNAGTWAARLLLMYVSVNVSLMLFNLIPLPPLDGSKILMPLFKGEALRRYYQVQRYAMPIMLVLLFVLPEYLGIDPVGAFVGGVGGQILDLLLGA